jgi:hypothetical protein
VEVRRGGGEWAGGGREIVPCISTRARPSLRTATLFLALGVAYMFVQMWAIYKLSQFVAHPLLAAALVLSAMLAASVPERCF